MVRRIGFLVAIVAIVVAHADAAAAQSDLAQRTEEARRTELAFAKTMADRNVAEFQIFLADDTVFWTDDQTILTGRVSLCSVEDHPSDLDLDITLRLPHRPV